MFIFKILILYGGYANLLNTYSRKYKQKLNRWRLIKILDNNKVKGTYTVYLLIVVDTERILQL